jgi:hypothetical protein
MKNHDRRLTSENYQYRLNQTRMDNIMRDVQRHALARQAVEGRSTRKSAYFAAFPMLWRSLFHKVTEFVKAKTAESIGWLTVSHRVSHDQPRTPTQEISPDGLHAGDRAGHFQ